MTPNVSVTNTNLLFLLLLNLLLLIIHCLLQSKSFIVSYIIVQYLIGLKMTLDSHCTLMLQPPRHWQASPAKYLGILSHHPTIISLYILSLVSNHSPPPLSRKWSVMPDNSNVHKVSSNVPQYSNVHK